MTLFVYAKSRGHWPWRSYAMSKILCGIAGPVILTGALFICGAPNDATARVNLGDSVNIGPPPIVDPEPTEVVMVPGSRSI